MKLPQFLSVAALCGFAAASPLPGNAIAERENLYARPYGLKMKDDAFKKRENLYGRPYTLKMEDDAFEKRNE
ncbi:hypothetical protein FPOAC2_04110 [Fusarium poae]|uniref:hypothetical protein n=1 Tax=Fusarium poae TaxID=36050 RepID=UPI001CEB57FF|nr:hypothetical protein FPOAC1_004041 [Fusarium poae]KAG8670807.1 hypothetical protein FPOAC1_004041 [Fusarium poae]